MKIKIEIEIQKREEKKEEKRRTKNNYTQLRVRRNTLYAHTGTVPGRGCWHARCCVSSRRPKQNPETNSPAATLLNVRETYHHFPEQVQAHFMSSGTMLEQVTQAFFLHGARKSPDRQNGPMPMLGASQSFEYRKPTGRVIIVILVTRSARADGTPNRAQAGAAVQCTWQP